MKAPKIINIPSKKIVVDEYAMGGDLAKKVKRETDPRPEFVIDAETLPAIKDWNVGKKYKLEIEVEMVGSRIEDWGANKGKLTGNFKISGIMVEDDMDEEEEEMPKAMRMKK